MDGWALFDGIYAEAKRDNPEDPWALFNAICCELSLSRAYKAVARGSQYHNPMVRLVRAAQRRDKRAQNRQ